jgi:hypothetical protein
MKNISIFCTVIDFLSRLLLFMYRECAVAGVFFWFVICVFTNIMLMSPRIFQLNNRELMLIIMRIHEFYFVFFVFAFCFSCITCILLFSNHTWNEDRLRFFVTFLLYVLTLMLFFLIPGIQSA